MKLPAPKTAHEMQLKKQAAYQVPRIVYEILLETRAGSPLILPFENPFTPSEEPRLLQE